MGTKILEAFLSGAFFVVILFLLYYFTSFEGAVLGGIAMVLAYLNAIRSQLEEK